MNADQQRFNEQMDDRARDIFRRIVESYLTQGEPLGSRNLSKQLPVALSPASVRNVMSDLEALGLIYAPHISAGRMPTEQGLRFFVDAFMDTGEVTQTERQLIEQQLDVDGGADTERVLTEASTMLSNVSRGAGLVLTSKREGTLKHIEFVQLEPTKALAVLVWDSGDVENRVIEIPAGITASQMSEAANFLNHNARGQTLDGARQQLSQQRETIRSELDTLSADLVERGLVFWGGSNGESNPKQLIVRGRANLLEDLNDAEDIARAKLLLDDLERKDEIVQMLDRAETGSGVRIFIGSENSLFSLSGSSLLVAPYRDTERKVVGALGVIGPTRLNYARIVPMLDYTAQLISKMIERK
ncbi:MAG: heat-inducible transcriptional repressor HrcA [Pseudomonadota bacterium]